MAILGKGYLWDHLNKMQVGDIVGVVFLKSVSNLKICNI